MGLSVLNCAYLKMCIRFYFSMYQIDVIIVSCFISKILRFHLVGDCHGADGLKLISKIASFYAFVDIEIR